MTELTFDEIDQCGGGMKLDEFDSDIKVSDQAPLTWRGRVNQFTYAHFGWFAFSHS